METIKSYIDNLFITLPRTPEVEQLRADILLHLEEKYEELLAQGKSSSEAIGTVIMEFGSIEEITTALELTLPAAEESTSQMVPSAMADNYLAALAHSHWFVAWGVFLCLAAPAIFIFLTDFSSRAEVPGLVLLLILIAIAVGLFIYGDSFLEPYQVIEKGGDFVITPETKAYLTASRAQQVQSSTRGVIAGISVILGAIVVFFIFTSLSFSMASTIGLSLLLLGIGAGTALLIISGSQREGYDKLLQVGDYSSTQRKKGKVIGAVAAVYWPIATIVFLCWGFFGARGFGISWIVWPIAGILFGLFASVTSMFMDEK